MIFEGIDLGPSTPETRAESAKRFAGYALGLVRRRPMKRSAMKRSAMKRSAMKRSAMKRSAMKRSKPKGVPESVKAAVLRRSGNSCEHPACGGYLNPLSGHFHHVLKRSQGGKHTADNLRFLCPFHHEWVEAHPAEAVALGLSEQRGKVTV